MKDEKELRGSEGIKGEIYKRFFLANSRKKLFAL